MSRMFRQAWPFESGLCFSTHRVGINENDLLHVQWKQHVQKEDFVAPNGALLLRLLMQPSGPFVLHQFVLEIIFFGHVRQKIDELRREVVFQEPEFHRRLGVFQQRQHHDAQQSLVQMARRNGENVKHFRLLYLGSGAAATAK